MNDTDLDLVETDALLDALERRYPEGVVLVGNRAMSKHDSTTHTYFRGSPAMALGLLAYAKVKIEQSLVDDEDPS